MLRRGVFVGACYLKGHCFKSARFSFNIDHIRVASSVPVTANQARSDNAKELVTDITALLQRSNSPEEIYDLVKQYGNVLNNRQIIQAFETLNSCWLNADCKNRTPFLTETAFRSLCNRATYKMRFFDLGDVITILKICTRFNVPASSSIVQSSCQMLRHQINRLTLSQVMFVNFLLSQMSSKSALTEALKIALPLVFQSQISLQLDATDREQVYKCIIYALSHAVDPVTTEFIAKALLSSVTSLSLEQATNVALAMCSYPYLWSIDSLKEVRESILQIIAKSIDQVPERTIRAIISSSKRGLFSADLYAALWQQCIQKRWPLWLTCMLVEGSIRHEYVIPVMVDHLCEEILSKKEEVLHDKRVSVISLAQGVTALGDRTDKIRKACEIILESGDKLENVEALSHMYARVVRCLTDMQCFSKDMLDRVFSTDFANAIREKVPAKRLDGVLLDMLQIQQNVLVDMKNTSYRMDSSLEQMAHSTLERLSSNLTFQIEPLKSALESAFGGEQFVEKALQTPQGHLIDFLVVLDSTDTPIAIRTDASPSDKVARFSEVFRNVPKNSKAVAIIVGDYSKYWRCSGVVKGSTLSAIRHLSKLQMFPYLVPLTRWYSLLEQERVPYLVREIKTAVKQNQASVLNADVKM